MAEPVEVETIQRPQTVDEPEVVAVEPVERREVLRSASSVRAERRQQLAERFGGFSWGADFIGFAVAIFFLIVFLGIVGAIVGATGYQMNAPVPRAGAGISGATQNLGLEALIGSLIALFLAYFIGGYTAGRMARFDGAKNGVGVVIWTVIVAVILGILGGALGSKFNVAGQLHLKIDTTSLTTAGIISLVITLAVMLSAAAYGGRVGEHYHEVIERNAGVLR